MIKAVARKAIDTIRYALTPTHEVTVHITGHQPKTIKVQGPAAEVSHLLDRLAANPEVTSVTGD